MYVLRCAGFHTSSILRNAILKYSMWVNQSYLGVVDVCLADQYCLHTVYSQKFLRNPIFEDF